MTALKRFATVLALAGCVVLTGCDNKPKAVQNTAGTVDPNKTYDVGGATAAPSDTGGSSAPATAPEGAPQAAPAAGLVD